MDFEDALPIILKYEGGKADVKGDRGGRTNKGITQATYDSARKRWGQPAADVWEIADHEVARIYRESFWDLAGCPMLPWPLSLCQFDAAVQHGVRNAITLLQRAAGAPEDGKLGPTTLGAAKSQPAGKMTRVLLRQRRGYYLRIVQARPDQLKFLLGWLLRVERLNDRCISDYSEVE